MFKLCSLPHPDKEELLSDCGSLFQQELKACLEEANRRNVENEVEELTKFCADCARCVKIVQLDAADEPATNHIVLASPRTAWKRGWISHGSYYAV